MLGKIIVFEGIDGSGKSTQARLLAKKLQKKGFNAELLKFPQYNTFFGKIIKSYLLGKFGGINSIPTEVCALLYSLDKYSAKNYLEEKLSKGKIIVLDRYIASNAAHQGAKISNPKKQKDFLKWTLEVESKLPQPAITFFLDIPPKTTTKLMKGKPSDIHEDNFSYLSKVYSVYKKLSKQKNWKTIKCFENGKLKTVKEIQKLVLEEAEKIL